MKKSLYSKYFGLLILIGVLVQWALVLSGCPEAKTACQVIRAADTACTLIEVVGEDGKMEQVPVSPAEMQSLARTVSARKRDAGAR